MTFEEIIFWWLNSFAGKSEALDTAIIFSAVFLLYWMAGTILAFAAVSFYPKFKEKLRRNTELAIVALTSAIFARLAVTELIRFFYSRPRPFDIFGKEADFIQLVDHVSAASFPSGHAAFSFALAAAVSFYYPKTSILFFLAAVLIGAARITAGIHWPSDILGGAVIGIASAWIVKLIYQKFLEKSHT